MIDIRLASEQEFFASASAEAEARARGWVPCYFVSAEFARNPDDPHDAVFFRLAEGTGREPRRTEIVYEGEDADEALDAAIDADARGAVLVVLSEISAYDREQIAYERAFESRF